MNDKWQLIMNRNDWVKLSHSAECKIVGRPPHKYPFAALLICEPHTPYFKDEPDKIFSVSTMPSKTLKKLAESLEET